MRLLDISEKWAQAHNECCAKTRVPDSNVMVDYCLTNFYTPCCRVIKRFGRSFKTYENSPFFQEVNLFAGDICDEHFIGLREEETFVPGLVIMRVS